MKKRKLCMLMAAVVIATSLSSGATHTKPVTAETKVVAFPGAEGAGKYATGGRGGSVYYVTNLNDSGTGSLRDAVSQSNRIVVFKVGGTIELKSNLEISSNITIAGQTAPGGAGVTLKNYKAGLCGDNIIMRYISSRPGEKGTSADYDAFGGSKGSTSIIDHCSIGWANDEQWGLYSNNENYTTQYTIIGPANSFSYHSKGVHGFGIMLGKGNCSWHHNLIVHNVSRNYRGKVQGTMTDDFVNNVIYDWGYQTAYGTIGHTNYVGNYLKMGNSTKGGFNFMDIDSTTSPENFGLFLTGNKMVNIDGTDYSTLCSNNWSGITYAASTGRTEDNVKSTSAFSLTVDGEDVSVAKTAESADAAYDHVLSYAGAGINANSRPAIDQQVVEECETGTGSCTGARPYSEANATQKATIDKYNIACGVSYTYPSAVTSGAPTDSDSDGMPDYWEKERGLNPNSAYATDGSLEANGDYCGQGYTNIEYYINDLTVDSFPEGTVTVSPTTSTSTTTPSASTTTSPAATTSVSPSPSVTAATTVEAPLEEGIYMIKNRNSNKYLDVADGTAANGTNIQQWGASGAATYNCWKVVKDSNGYYTLYSMLGDGSTYVMDVAGLSTADGTNICIFKSKDGDNQKFQITEGSDGTYSILTKISASKSCVEVADSSTDAGANVQESTFTWAKNQRWYFEKADLTTTVTPSASTTPASTEPSVSTTPVTSVEPSASSVAPSTTVSPTASSAAETTDKALAVTASGNGWSGGYNMTLTLKNSSAAAITDWKLYLDTSEVDMNSLWCGQKSVSGTTITITPETYNAELSSSASTSIGFGGTGDMPSVLTCKVSYEMNGTWYTYTKSVSTVS